jgi:hypothetical protein
MIGYESFRGERITVFTLDLPVGGCGAARWQADTSVLLKGTHRNSQVANLKVNKFGNQILVLFFTGIASTFS